MKGKRRSKRAEFMNNMKEHRVVYAFYFVIRFIVLASIAISVIRGRWENVFTCVLTLFLLLIPSIIERGFKINLPSLLEVIILLFVFAAEILGELQSYYIRYPFWDTMLHTVNGFICAAVGFALLDILNRNDKIKFSLNPAYLAVVAFCFSMTVGVLWEFFEYSADLIFHTDMQKDTVVNIISSVALDPNGANKAVIIDGITDVTVNGETLGVGGYLDIGLHDTMKDLIVNFIGAVVFSVIGYLYVKNRGKKKSIAPFFIPTLRDDGEREHSDV